MDIFNLTEEQLTILTVVSVILACIGIYFTIRYGRKKPPKEERPINETPLLKVVNKEAEPMKQSEPRQIVYNPNLINFGTIAASNIRIHDKAFERIVSIAELVRPEGEKEIKKRSYDYPGSLLPNDPIRGISIEWTINENPISIIRWIEYDYLNKKNQEVIFDVRFKLRKHLELIHYSHDDIMRARKDYSDLQSGKHGI